MTVKQLKENERLGLQLLMSEIDTDDKLRAKMDDVIKKREIHDRITVIVDMGLARLKVREHNKLKTRVGKVLSSMADEGILQRNWGAWYTVIRPRDTH